MDQLLNKINKSIIKNQNKIKKMRLKDKKSWKQS